MGHGAARRAERVPLDVEGDRAGAAGRRGDAHALAAGVDGHGQPALGGGLEDRQVARLAVRPVGAAAEEHLDEALVLGGAADLGGGGLRVLRRAEDRRAQARLGVEPALAQPLVVRPRQLGRPVRARHQRDEHGVVAVQDADVGAARIEQLAADRVDVGGRRVAVLVDVLPEPGGRDAPRSSRGARATAPARGTTRAAPGRRRRGAPPGRRSAGGCRSRSRVSQYRARRPRIAPSCRSRPSGPTSRSCSRLQGFPASRWRSPTGTGSSPRRRSAWRTSTRDAREPGDVLRVRLHRQDVHRRPAPPAARGRAGRPGRARHPLPAVVRGRSEHEPITIRHLLTHTSGLMVGADMSANSRFDVWALRETEAGFAAGSRYLYSNVGYRALGFVVEEVTGVAVCGGPADAHPRAARPRGDRPRDHQRGPAPARGRLRAALRRPPGAAHRPVGSGAVARDRHGRRLAGRDGGGSRRLPACAAEPGTGLMTPESFELMTTPAIEADDGWWYGFGLELRERDGRREIRHGGSMPGFGATMLGDLDSGLGVAVAVNGTDEGDVTEEVAEAVLDLYRDGPPPSCPDPLAVEDASMYEGPYVGEAGRLVLRGGRPPLPRRESRSSRAATIGSFADHPDFAALPPRLPPRGRPGRRGGARRRRLPARGSARASPPALHRSGAPTRATTAPTTRGTRTSGSSCARAS